MKIILTYHAYERSKDRNVSLQAIEKTLKIGNWTCTRGIYRAFYQNVTILLKKYCDIFVIITGWRNFIGNQAQA